MALNDKTSSVFVRELADAANDRILLVSLLHASVTKSAFDDAARECKLDPGVQEQLWAKLASTSTQRIIGGATAPRQDAANVNSWHWSEQDLAVWAKRRLTELLVGIEAQGVPNKGWVKVTKLESCTGEASASNRKGKRIVAFELNVKCVWEGQVDYDDVSGELLLPYVSEDVSDCQYEIKLTAKDPKDASHQAALRFLEKQLPLVKERLRIFTKEMYDDGNKE